MGFGSCLQCFESGPATIVGPKSDQDYRALGQDVSQPPHEIADTRQCRDKRGQTSFVL